MDSYVKLAQNTIESYFSAGRVIAIPNGLPKEMLGQRAGVFVTLYKNGKLRGCIGTISPTAKNIALEIIQNAISSAFEDSRFEPLQLNELKDLTYSVDVLNPPVRIKDKSELDIKKYGIICQSGNKSGVLLPDVEGIHSIEEQLEIACQKAEINPQKDKFDIYKFTVTRHE